MKQRCAVQGCSEPVTVQSARFCRQHYQALYRFKAKYPDSFTDEVCARFDDSCRADEQGCWIWVASFDQAGFPLFKTRTRHWIAFRHAYLRYIGDLKRHDLVLHTCGNVLCVNPDHLYVRRDGASSTP